MKFKNIPFYRLLAGAGYSVIASIKLTFLFALIIAIFQFPTNDLPTFISSLTASLIFITLIIGFISFLVSLIIGTPITFLLIYFNLDDELISGLIGGYLVLFIFIITGVFHLFALIYIVYGYYCGLYFMRGYKRS